MHDVGRILGGWEVSSGIPVAMTPKTSQSPGGSTIRSPPRLVYGTAVVSRALLPMKPDPSLRRRRLSHPNAMLKFCQNSG